MQKYPKKWRLLSSLLLCALCLLGGCQTRQPVNDSREGLIPDLISNQPQSSVTAYFKVQESEVLAPLVYAINSSRDTIWIALEKLLAGPPNDFVDAVIPQGVKMKDLYFSDGLVYIKLTGDVELTAADINLPAFWATVNLELLEQDNTTAGLLLYYNDQPLLEQPYTAAAVNDYGGGAKGAYVYFADPQAMYLAPLCLPIYEADYASYAGFLTALLQAWASPPPEGSGVYTTLSEGIELLGIEQQEDLLILNLGVAPNSLASSSQEHLLLDSLLATLAPCRQINQLKLLVNGEAVDFLPSGLDISQPLTVNHSLDAFNRVSQ